MPPMMTTQSVGRASAAPRGGRMGRWAGRGDGMTREPRGRGDGQTSEPNDQGVEANKGVDGVPNFSIIISQQFQNLLSTILAQQVYYRMDNPNITIEEYIRFEEEKARRRGKVYNWETATYGKIWYDEDVYNLRSIETEFLAIVFNDELSSEKTLSCEPTVNLENDNEKVNMPSLSSPEPTVSHFYDLDFLKDFENEFLAIVYNDALTSKSDSLTEPVEIHHHIDEFDLKTKTSLSECDEEEQNVLYFNDLFPFNIIYPHDLESDKDNDDNEINIIQSSGNIMVKIYNLCTDLVDFADMALPPRIRELMEEGLSGRMLMEHKDAQGQGVFTSRAWRRLFEIKGLLVESARQISNKGDLSAYWIGISSAGDFLGTASSYTSIRDPMLRLCHRLIACSIAGRSQAPKKVTVADLFHLRGMNVGLVNIPYLLARYLRLFTSRRKRKAMISRDLPVIDMAELVRLQICKELDDTWVWVASGPERQPDDAAGTLEVTEGAPDVVKVEEDENEIRGALEEHEVMDVMARDLSRFTVWAARGISQLLDTAGATYDLAAKKSTMLMKYLQSGILAQ
ncbi:hypothetical protein Tco_1562775 [Tanacetum coccineum]